MYIKSHLGGMQTFMLSLLGKYLSIYSSVTKLIRTFATEEKNQEKRPCMMKRSFLLMAFVAVAALAHAGGLMTNTNYHIAFDRMMARGASFDIDAAYSNPAGLAWGHEGWQLSLNFQKPWQHRDVTLTSPLQQKYEGKENIHGAVMASDGFFPFPDSSRCLLSGGRKAPWGERFILFK